jgi:hypothetical protein
MIGNILLVFAFVFAIIASVFVERVDKPPFSIHFGWLAIGFWILSILLGAKWG